MCITQRYVACGFFRTAQPDTLAQVGAYIWATASRANVTATLIPVSRKVVSARYEGLSSSSLFLLKVVLIHMVHHWMFFWLFLIYRTANITPKVSFVNSVLMASSETPLLEPQKTANHVPAPARTLTIS